MTTRQSVRFTVKEFNDGKFWLALEPIEPGVGESRELLGLDLAPGTSQNQAEELCRLLNAKVVSVSRTSLPLD